MIVDQSYVVFVFDSYAIVEPNLSQFNYDVRIVRHDYLVGKLFHQLTPARGTDEYPQ